MSADITTYLISTSTTITRKMMTINKITVTPLKMPIMFPLLADGSVLPWVVVMLIGGMADDVSGVVESGITITPVKSHRQSRPC